MRNFGSGMNTNSDIGNTSVLSTFNFYNQQAKNERRSKLLTIILVVLVMVSSLMVAFLMDLLVVATVGAFSDSLSKMLIDFFCFNAGYWFSYVVTVSLWLVIVFERMKKILADPVEPTMNTARAKEIDDEILMEYPKAQMVVDLLDELSAGLGINPPRAFIVLDSKEVNAFAVGSPEDSGVAVTLPLLKMMNREELSGVLGHELAHIKAYDSQTTLKFSLCVAGFLFIQTLGYYLWLFDLGSDSDDDDDGSGSGYIALVGLGLMIVGWTFKMFGILLSLVMSRTREFQADAVSAKLNSDREGLISALSKIEVIDVKKKDLDLSGNNKTAALCFAGFKKGFFNNLLADHPSTESRIKRLEQV